MSQKNFYAHSREGSPSEERHLLKDHLKSVAHLASEFAKPFGGNEWAYLGGLLHDLGKFRDEFQEYLRKERSASKDTQHAVYGAKWAGQRERDLLPCAFGIAGHHSGLHDLSGLQNMLDDSKRRFDLALPEIVRRFEAEIGPMPELPKSLQWVEDNIFAVECYTRMLFSCIVDGDRLDTACWPDKPMADRLLDAEHLLGCLLAERSRKTVDNPNSVLNGPRNRIFDACLIKSEQPQGFFSLTVPTGGGKTLSAMAFALAHAKRHGLCRVIVVIPYLSIIEQNAEEYRRIFGNSAVLESHSAVDPTVDASEEEKSRLELAAENWDAPIIVTTSVQFLESLFSASPSRCRKLHRIPRSVVIFDEVQTLPAHMLQPVFSMFRELARNYGVSFVFSSATQPAFRKCASLPDGFTTDELREIADNPPQLFRELRRVNYHLPKDDEALDWIQLAEKLAVGKQVLCVVNLVRHAATLWEELKKILPADEKPIHLSAAMYPQHRLDKLTEIRKCLKENKPCRVIATQLVEAGVDVDFPVVWRADGPLDSIVQVAGRCNREGRTTLGEMHVFRPADHKLPSGLYRTAADQSAITLAALGGGDAAAEKLATEAHLFDTYFNSLWQVVEIGREIQEERAKLHFRTVAEKAKVISDSGQPVIVYHGIGKNIVDEIRSRPVFAGQPRFNREDLRRLQRFMVNVRTHKFQLLRDQWKGLKPLLLNLELYVLGEGFYHNDLGLIIDNRPMEDFIQ